MDNGAHLALAGWDSFYVIVGSSAAALTGLQFVVVALIKESPLHPTEETIGAFSTPTIVHFVMALLTSAVLSAPWHVLWHVGVALVLCGVGGLVYALLVIRRSRRQTDYQPVLEDWIWHAILPVTAYAALTVAGALLAANPAPALFWVGGGTLLLLLIGIHNAWDSVTYITLKSDHP